MIHVPGGLIYLVVDLGRGLSLMCGRAGSPVCPGGCRFHSGRAGSSWWMLWDPQLGWRAWSRVQSRSEVGGPGPVGGDLQDPVAGVANDPAGGREEAELQRLRLRQPLSLLLTRRSLYGRGLGSCGRIQTWAGR